MPQTEKGVVVTGGGGHLSESARPFSAILFRDSAHFTVSEAGPTLKQRDKDLIPVMASAGFDRYVIGLVLLMNLERFRARHFGRGLVPSGNLLLAVLVQKCGKLRLRY
jgi:hypothetical protein